VTALDAPPSPFGQRSRIALRIDGSGTTARAGLPARTGGITAVESCLATDPRADTAARAVFATIRERRVEGVRAVVAHAALSDDLHVTLIAETGRLPHAQRLAETANQHGATGVSLNVHEGQGRRLFGRRIVPLAGRPSRIEKVDDLELNLGPLTFFESSAHGATALVRAMRRAAPPTADRIVDLYSGCGMASLALADRARRVIQVDSSADACRDAERCAAPWGDKVEIRRAHVERELIPLGDTTTDLAIVDPPGDGCPDLVVEQIARVLRPGRILLVGRSTATFARNVGAFAMESYAARRIDAIDADPLSRELVTVATLER
jgi:23S rRNA (uracil1939-C5)-methyltransferase